MHNSSCSILFMIKFIILHASKKYVHTSYHDRCQGLTKHLVDCTDHSLTLTTTQVNSNNVAATYPCPLRYVTPAIIIDATCAIRSGE